MPMQWSAGANAGFTSHQRAARLIDSGKFSYKKVNVEAQEFDPGSLLNWLGKLARARRRCTEVGLAVPEVIDTGHAGDRALAYRGDDRILLTLHHVSRKKLSLLLQLPHSCDGPGRIIVSSRPEEGTMVEEGDEHELEGFGCRWILFTRDPTLSLQ